MPWNNQGGGGGGPWGSPPGGGNRNPWGSGSGGGGGGGFGGQQPDIDELIRKGRDRLNRMIPGGFGGGKGLAAVVAILLVLWGLTGFYRVQPDEHGVVLRFGQWVRTEEMPGLKYHLPSPIEAVRLPKVTRVNSVEVGYRTGVDPRRPGTERDVPDESLMLTGDENIIDIDFVVFWQIANARDYLFQLREPDGTVRRVAESAMREIIGRTEIQPALTDARQEIEVQTRRLLQDMLDEYRAGVRVTQVQLRKVDPPAPVVDAFNEVQRARSDRERLRNEAEAYRNDVIPRARGESERLLQEAAAYREEVVNLAEGDARRFLSVLQAYRLAPEVTANRLYLETMEQVMRGTNKVIIDANGQDAQGVVPYLPLNELMRRPGAPAQGQPAGGGAAGQQPPRR